MIFKIVSPICQNILTNAKKSKTVFSDINQIIPKGEYFRYNGFWNQKSSSLICDVAIAWWLLKSKLLTHDDAKEIIGNDCPLDDYLYGVAGISSEMARLTINMVIRGDYKTPQMIDLFLKDFYNGFKLFNLKNDALRKRFDSIKYDIKKVEQVMYDLSINKLV